MNKKIPAFLLAASLLMMSACGEEPAPETPTPTPVVEETAPPTERPVPPDVNPIAPTSTPDGGQTPEKPENTPAPTVPPSPTPTPAPTPGTPATKESIAKTYYDAMTAQKSEVSFDISGIQWEFGAENDLKNIFYSVTSEHPELKYTYSIEPSISGNTAVCKFRYMPYATGAYANSVPSGSHTIGSLHDVDVMAQSMIDGKEKISIAITDPKLLVDDIHMALAQAGYGWIRFELNEDGTEIIAKPTTGKTLDECVTAINDTFQFGSQILSEIVTNEMSDYEKAKAIYGYIAGNVAYDFRYYSDWENMPFESMVAIGALRDHLAICGGYAQAFETLLDMSGIENYTVSGVSHGENHMWNYVVLDGKGYYCDPTADRGGMDKHFMLTADALEEMGGYTWNRDFLEKISGTEG